MKWFFDDYVNDLKKMDSILAFIVIFGVHYAINNNLIFGLFFASLTVVVFLLILNIIHAFQNAKYIYPTQ
tara:strand:+ start:130 stop:339 length:210 start_codon:yes stop_codon:yes gene_type:complete